MQVHRVFLNPLQKSVRPLFRHKALRPILPVKPVQCTETSNTHESTVYNILLLYSYVLNHSRQFVDLPLSPTQTVVFERPPTFSCSIPRHRSTPATSDSACFCFFSFTITPPLQYSIFPVFYSSIIPFYLPNTPTLQYSISPVFFYFLNIVFPAPFRSWTACLTRSAMEASAKPRYSRGS